MSLWRSSRGLPPPGLALFVFIARRKGTGWGVTPPKKRTSGEGAAVTPEDGPASE